MHKWQTAYITLDMCHRQAFIEIQQVSFIKYRLILADLQLHLLQIQLKMSLQKSVFSHVSLKASELLIKQIWKILKHAAKGKQSRVFLEHELAGGKGHSIDRLQTKGTSFSGSWKQKSSFAQKRNICEPKNALQQQEKVKKIAQPVQDTEDVPCVYCPHFFNISHKNGEALAK